VDCLGLGRGMKATPATCAESCGMGRTALDQEQAVSAVPEQAGLLSAEWVARARRLRFELYLTRWASRIRPVSVIVGLDRHFAFER